MNKRALLERCLGFGYGIAFHLHESTREGNLKLELPAT
jgi:hypothetical protein